MSYYFIGILHSKLFHFIILHIELFNCDISLSDLFIICIIIAQFAISFYRIAHELYHCGLLHTELFSVGLLYSELPSWSILYSGCYFMDIFSEFFFLHYFAQWIIAQFARVLLGIRLSPGLSVNHLHLKHVLNGLTTANLSLDFVYSL